MNIESNEIIRELVNAARGCSCWPISREAFLLEVLESVAEQLAFLADDEVMARDEQTTIDMICAIAQRARLATKISRLVPETIESTEAKP